MIAEGLVEDFRCQLDGGGFTFDDEERRHIGVKDDDVGALRVAVHADGIFDGDASGGVVKNLDEMSKHGLPHTFFRSECDIKSAQWVEDLLFSIGDARLKPKNTVVFHHFDCKDTKTFFR